jgi:hypothetical protein
MRITFFRWARGVAWVSLLLGLNACAFLAGLTTDAQLLQADRDRSAAQGEFRKNEINHQNQTP